MTAQSVVGPVLVDLAAPVPLGRDRAESPDAAVDRLCRQMREVCASAVDPLEIAAALEAEAGLTGPTLRARYGCPDVFTLADEMYRRHRPVARRTAAATGPVGRGPANARRPRRALRPAAPRRTRWRPRC